MPFRSTSDRIVIPLMAIALGAVAVAGTVASIGSLQHRESHQHPGGTHEAQLPEMLEIADAGVSPSGLRRLEVTVHPKIEGNARLTIEGVRDARSGAAVSRSLALKRGDEPTKLSFDLESSESHARVGLVFTNERGEVTMTVHRELDGEDNAAAQSGLPAHIITDALGRSARTSFPSAPEPIVSERRP